MSKNIEPLDVLKSIVSPNNNSDIFEYEKDAVRWAIDRIEELNKIKQNAQIHFDFNIIKEKV